MDPDRHVPGPTAPVLGPVRVRRAVDEVADRLLTAIALGEFSVGDRLPSERELTGTLGVSRPTVRAAIARLRDLGCVDVVRGRAGGHYVRAGWHSESAPAIRRILLPRWQAATALLDTRCLIESLIARTAAERRTARDVAAIRAALAAYEDMAGAGQMRRADARLHEAVAGAAHDEQLAAYSAQLLEQATAGFPIEPFSGGLTAQALTDHRALAAAVAAGDGDQAAAIARQHFTITATALRRTLDRTLGGSRSVPIERDPAEMNAPSVTGEG
jgi:GntR family transcriptional regulator, transcriptional repressor for pyruvate dehydrogenase complex